MKYIDQDSQLQQAVRAVAASSWAAVDTEADSLHHYIEKLCLLQVSVPGEDFVIDPLVGLDLQPLADALGEKFLILHGADFDLRMIKKYWGFKPVRIFDTMIAAQLLGYDKQGLADLARRHCDVDLPKAGQKADWSKRPLDDKLLVYAANDTHYLKAIHDLMSAELKALNRLEWHRQSCERLVRSILASKEAEPDAERDWRVKGSRALSGKALTILRELWKWREEEARRRDRPRFKVFNSDLLVEIASWWEKNQGSDVALMPEAPRNLRGEYRDAINRVIRQAAELPAENTVCPPKVKGRPRLDAKETKRWEALRTAREGVAKELNIHPSLIATNATLEIIAMKQPRDTQALASLECLMPWQAELAGERFLKALMV